MFKKLLPFMLAALSVSTIYAQTVAYVTNNQSNNVSVINTSTNTVTATIPVGKVPSGIAFSPDGTRVYVMNTGENTISVIDTATNAVTATIALGGRPRLGPELLAITPDGKSLYVTLERGSVLVINTATNTVVATIPVPTAGAVAISPDGSRAYVQTVLTAGVFVIDTASKTVIAHIPVPSNFSAGIAAMPDGTKVYASGGVRHPDVFVIDVNSNTIVATITCPGGPQGIAFSADGRTAYVANELKDAVYVVDTVTNTVEPGAIAVGKDPALVSLTPDGKFLYVTNFQWGEVNSEPSTVSVIDTSTKKVVATVPVGSIPDGIVIANLNSPFAKFTAEKLNTRKRKVDLHGNFTLGTNSPGLNLARQSVTLTVGNVSRFIPAGTFKQADGNRDFVFHGTIGGAKMNLDLKAKRGSRTDFSYIIQVKDAGLDTPNPLNVVLKIGPNTGTTVACRNHCDSVTMLAKADSK
jgi:YVTN family beta-propeller protein